MNAVLDGTLEEQLKNARRFLNSLTKEEHERAMSHEFDYLDVDDDTVINLYYLRIA